MNLFLQMGHGMMELSRRLIPKMTNPSVILSPRDLKEAQMINYAQKSNGVNILLDPQLYAPHCNHPTLTTQSYWIDNYQTTDIFSNNKILKEKLLDKLLDINENIGTSSIILPGFYSDTVNSTWLRYHEMIIESVESVQKEKLATICLSEYSFKDYDSITYLLTQAESWPVDGFYIIPEHPKAEYLVSNPIWLLNLLILCAFLKNQQKKVVIGYSNQQMLLCSCTNVDAIASGTFMNVRSFDLGKFNEKSDNNIKRKRTWYYCPDSLSEYTTEFLDIAQRNNVLKAFSPKGLGGGYADHLFSGAVPSTINFKENDAFAHYLLSLDYQCSLVSKSNYTTAYDTICDFIDKAQHSCDFAERYGVRGRNRDFSIASEACLSALLNFDKECGFMMKRIWNY